MRITGEIVKSRGTRRSNAVAVDQVGHMATATKKWITPIVLYPRRSHFNTYREACLSEELPKKLPKSSFVPHGGHAPSAGTVSNIEVASYRACLRHPNCAYPFASGPSALAVGPINRSIEEERRVQVLVRDNNVDQALKVLKKKMQREGVFREMKLRGHYEKPSEGGEFREKAEAIRRARKLARKKMQREGLLPMKPRVIARGPSEEAAPRALLASDLRTTVTDTLDKISV